MSLEVVSLEVQNPIIMESLQMGIRIGYDSNRDSRVLRSRAELFNQKQTYEISSIYSDLILESTTRPLCPSSGVGIHSRS
jgi:hypothetical protein